jgi:hypothetical protein
MRLALVDAQFPIKAATPVALGPVDAVLLE